MSTLHPPAQKIWWKQPLDRTEGTWIVIALIWCIIMFAMMPLWHIYGKQNISNEAYRTTPEAFMKKTQAMVDEHTIRTISTENYGDIPVVKPPAGADIYILGRLWQWWPNYELKKGETYRVHLSSVDWQHGFSLQPLNINLQVMPGYEMVIAMTPDTTGEFTIVCNEYCGIGHHTMVGKIYVVE